MQEIKQQAKELWAVKIGPKSNQFDQEKVLLEIIETVAVKVFEEAKKRSVVETEMIVEQVVKNERIRMRKIVENQPRASINRILNCDEKAIFPEDLLKEI